MSFSGSRLLPPAHSGSADAHALDREAADLLARALGAAGTLHLPGARDRHRLQLEQAIELARGVLGAAESEPVDPETLASARVTLVNAYAARARDARHGAGQLSLGSQRAPTPEACDDGWRRVESIVVVAEESARHAARVAEGLAEAGVLGSRRARKAAREAEAAAREARRLVDERNHAFTFHTDPAFSFGEGWYCAAAALLAGVTIQIEPGRPQTSQAERFLLDAGLGSRLQPYRSRPRANKQLTAIVANAFRADPLSAQRRLRAAFLGDASIPPAIVDWTARRLAGAPARRKVLLWIRRGAHGPTRNTRHDELVLLAARALAAGLVPVLFGEAVEGDAPAGAIDLTLVRTEPLFQGDDTRRAQLMLFEHLEQAHGLVGQVGVTSAGPDGPALMGLPMMYLTDAPNPRMRQWVGTIPGYREVVRDPGYLDRVTQTFGRWAEGDQG